MLTDSLPVVVWNFDAEVSGRVIAAVMRNPDVVRVVVEDENGKIFVRVESPERRGGLVLTEARALLYQGRPVGRVTIEMATGRLDQGLLQEHVRQGLALGAQVLVSLGFILLLFHQRIHVPLRSLRARAEGLGAFASTHWRYRADEIGQLARWRPCAATCRR
jgi:hypothetical protein